MTEWQSNRELPPENRHGAPKPASLSGKLRATQPRLTLPSMPRVPAVPSPQQGTRPRTPQPASSSGLLTRAGMQHTTPLKKPAPPQLSQVPERAAFPIQQERAQPLQIPKGVVVIPGKKKGTTGERHGLAGRAQLVILLCALTALGLGVAFGGVLKNGASFIGSPFDNSSGSAGIAQPPTNGPTLPPELDTTDTTYYINKYGFDAPQTVKALPDDEMQRLKQMLPYAVAATARYDARYQGQVEPQMLLWWTHAEEIGARINYSNCANESPPSGSYFISIMNCDRPDFWQLGYGNQFGNIWVLKDAFTDMHGNPNDPALVQQVGQAVLDYDKLQHTTPECGGYSCTFPAMTIDQIMADVHWHASDHRETESNWWASVLSRDPGINSYMLALALSSFSHEQTRTWVGCYYQEPCWQYESDSLWQILDNWKALGG